MFWRNEVVFYLPVHWDVCSRLYNHRDQKSMPRTWAGVSPSVRPRALTTTQLLPHSLMCTVNPNFIYTRLFFPPTQVVVMEGMNTTGRKLTASKIYEVRCISVNDSTNRRWRVSVKCFWFLIRLLSFLGGSASFLYKLFGKRGDWRWLMM